MRTIIINATIVNEGETFKGFVVSDGSFITKVGRGRCDIMPSEGDEVVEADGLYLLPGVIDSQVHFREPGLTSKGDIDSESRAAAAGGVTSFMDNPTTVPATTSIVLLEDKFRLAAEKSHVNYSFYYGGTKSNIDTLKNLDPAHVCGVKVYMDDDSLGKSASRQDKTLKKIMEQSPVLVVVHCEDRTTIKDNIKQLMKRFKGQNDFPVRYHSRICNVDACFNATLRAVLIARETGARLHVAQISSEKELWLFQNATLEEKRITAQVCVANLMFHTEDYDFLGPRIKTDPAVKSLEDRDSLRKGMIYGLVDLVSSDHAPHLLSDKIGGALHAASGMPMIQVSLVSMLELSDKGVLPVDKVVELMCHNPARLYNIDRRGFIREGYYADMVLVDPEAYWQVRGTKYYCKCGWNPMDEHTFKWRVKSTYVNGNLIFHNGDIVNETKGMALVFNYKNKC
ncbi:MAG: amidohydrolase family protein [Bacteroidaceae bacterium]|nr:amidohydrolase family protein [Bacteroidaceae bacterium]